MQVELSTVVSAFSGIAVFVIGGYVAVLRFALETKEKDLERRLIETRKIADDADVEVARIRIRMTEMVGELALTKQAAEHTKQVMDEMKEDATRDTEMMQRGFRDLMNELRTRTFSRYGSTQAMPAAPTTSPPPRPDKRRDP